MPNVSLVDIAKMFLRVFLYGLLLSVVSSFLNYTIGLIPPLNLTGCSAHYASLLGLDTSIRLFVSILSYGFTVKFSIRYFSGYLN